MEPPMTATELYEMVRGDPEVWGEEMLYENDWGWLAVLGRLVLPDSIAELALEALYARATGCGVSYNHPTDGAVNDGPDARWFARDWAGDIHAHSQATRLHALVAAYRANKESPR